MAHGRLILVLQAFEAMAAQMSSTEKLLPKSVSATRKNEICLAAGTSATTYNQMAGMHQEARAAFKSWCAYFCVNCVKYRPNALQVQYGSQR